MNNFNQRQQQQRRRQHQQRHRQRQRRRNFGRKNSGCVSSALLLIILLAAAVGIFIFSAPIMATLFPDRADPPAVYEYETIQTQDITQALVTRVIDGDTIEIEGGERVRLIGVDAPEMGFHGAVYEYGATAATEFVSDMILGQTVWLEPDGNNTDRFGRLRRYVWIQEPVNPTDEQEIRAYMLNAMLLEHGLAEVMILGNPRIEELFIKLCATNSIEN